MEVTYTRNDKIVRRKFFQYLIPTVLMVLAMQFGSLADAIVLGNFLGDLALSASSLALPMVFFVQIPGMAIGAGAAIVIANLLGKRQIQDASKAFKLSLILAFMISLVFIPIGIFAAEPIAKLFAGNFQNLVPMITQYMQMYCYQAPIMCAGIVIAYSLPSDNNPQLGAAFFIICNVVHIAAEILFCVFLDKSVAMYGAAASMGIGMLAGYVVLIPYALSKARVIDIKASMKGSLPFAKDVFRAGSSSGVLCALMCVFCIVLNFAATAYLKDPELPVFAMLSNFGFVIDLFIIGILQIMPSVVSSLFGEKDYFGVRSVSRMVFMLSGIVTVVLVAISMLFPELFFMMFGVDLVAVREATAQIPGLNDPLLVVRVYCLSMLVYSINKFFVYYYPSIMANVPAIVSNVLRTGLVGPVAIYFLMMGFGAIGYAYGAIIMEVATCLLVLALIFIGKKMGRFQGKGILLLPEASKNEVCLDISIPAKEEEISKVIEELQSYAEKISGDPKAAAMLALASEEIIANTIAYGYRRKHTARYIDVNLSRNENALIVRIRDDGITFDPTAFGADDEEEFRFHGIDLVRKIASNFKYLRVLNMNNTIMEITTAK